jgi:hypothetical protein
MSKTDWINIYGNDTKTIQKFQAGGPMAPEAAAPAGPEAGGQPDLQAMLAEYAQSRNPELAVAICDSLVEMMAAQGGAPQGGAPMARRGARMNAPRF